MKKIITSAFVLLLTIGAAQAQSTSTGKQHPHKKEHRMGRFDELNLTADQKTRLQSLKADFRKQMAELKNQNLSESDLKARRKELHQSFKTQAESILTREQKEQLQKLKAERKATGFRKGQGGFHKNGAAFLKELNLTAEQQAKMQQIRTGYRSKFQALRNDNALTAEQKKEKMQALRKEQQKEMKAVLTKEQVEKLQELRKEHRNRNTR